MQGPLCASICLGEETQRKARAAGPYLGWGTAESALGV